MHSSIVTALEAVTKNEERAEAAERLACEKEQQALCLRASAERYRQNAAAWRERLAGVTAEAT